MQLSNRLKAVAGLLSKGRKLADVGTDHAYIPIYLMKQGLIDSAVAMDIGKGPLERAKEHISLYGLEDSVTTRLSDGVAELKPGEADCMVVAGMGGALTIHILEEGAAVISTMKECILQPQSEIEKVRRYLWQHEFYIEEENMILEDGKFYPMMRVIPHKKQEMDKKLLDVYAQYGPCLLEKKHPVLKQYLEKEKRQNEQLCEKLEQNLPDTKERLEELRAYSALIQKAMRIISEYPERSIESCSVRKL